MAADTQIVELLGRQRLIAELVRDGLEVAIPVRDCGVDLIAYAELSRQVIRFSSKPIQMKASSGSAFAVDRKYGAVSDLILAYVWHLVDPEKAVTYAMTFQRAVEIATEMGWTKTASWESGIYTSTKPSQKLLQLLEKHRVGRGAWLLLITEGNLHRPDIES